MLHLDGTKDSINRRFSGDYFQAALHKTRCR